MAILQTLNLSHKAYWQQLQEIEFHPDYHPRLLGQKIQATCFHWLCPEALPEDRIVEADMVEH